MKMINWWYIGVTGYGRSTVSAGSKEKVPRVFSPTVTAEVQLLWVWQWWHVKFSYHGLRQSSSYCEFDMWSYSYHKLREHTGCWALVWKEETEPVVLRVTSARRARYICTQRYLNILDKLATRPHDKEKRRPAMPSKANSETESDRLARYHYTYHMRRASSWKSVWHQKP